MYRVYVLFNMVPRNLKKLNKYTPAVSYPDRSHTQPCKLRDTPFARFVVPSQSTACWPVTALYCCHLNKLTSPGLNKLTSPGRVGRRKKASHTSSICQTFQPQSSQQAAGSFYQSVGYQPEEDVRNLRQGLLLSCSSQSLFFS